MKKTPFEIGSLIDFDGSLAIVVDHDYEHTTPNEPFNWIKMYWCDDQQTTWEVWEDNIDNFKIVG